MKTMGLRPLRIEMKDIKLETYPLSTKMQLEKPCYGIANACHSCTYSTCACRAKIPQSSGGQYRKRLDKLGCHDSCERKKHKSNETASAVAAPLVATFETSAHTYIKFGNFW